MSFDENTSKTFHVRACRICLDSKCSNMVQITEQSGLMHLFEYCFGLLISTSDLPQSLCEQCVENVKKYSEFKELCYKSHTLWKSLTTVKCCAEKIRNNSLVKIEITDNEIIKNDCHDSNDFNFETFHNDFNNFGNIMPNEFNINTTKETANDEIPSDKLLPNNKNTPILLKDENMQSTSDFQSNIGLCSSHNVVNKTDKNIFKCKWCHQTYGNKLCYLKHVKLCNKRKTKQSIISPNQTHNSEIKLETNTSGLFHFCGICKFSTKHFDVLIKHLEGHWTDNDLNCKTCEFVAKDQAAMAAHRYTHYTSKVSNFLCHICKKKTKSKLTLEFHYRKAHLNKSGGLCSQPKCDKVYSTWKSWKRHEKCHNHPGYICDICGMKYKHKHLIAEHLLNHINPPTHVCDVCGKTFLRMRNLRSHIKNMHVASDPKKCTHCDRVFKNEHYLKIHQKVLSMEKVWKCEFCPMEYPLMSSLKSHLKSHSDERPFCCHICGSRYKAKSQLLIHMRNHSGDKPYKCLLCTKAFKSSQFLKRHVSIHTGILPHKCMHCGKMFHCKTRMMKHCLVRHKDVKIPNDTSS